MFESVTKYTYRQSKIIIVKKIEIHFLKLKDKYERRHD